MIEQAIAWFSSLVGKVTYSMTDRNGPSSYDCSSFVYHGLINGKLLPASIHIGNTDSLFGDLEHNGWVRVTENADGSISNERGDVGIWGKRGASVGASGHAMMWLDADNIVHCSSGYNGVHVDNHDWLWNLNGRPELTVYRYAGTTAANDSTDQIIEKGSFVSFTQSYSVDDLQQINRIWQIHTNLLCANRFNWDDNGIPAEMVIEVDANGYATPDQDLTMNSIYMIPGKYEVLDVGLTNNEWLALLTYNGMKFWVDVATVTEVGATSAGTPFPPNLPITPVEPPAPQPDQSPVQTPDIPNIPVNTTPAQSIPVVPTPTPQNDKPKENTMAFSQEQQDQLKINSEEAKTQMDNTNLAVVDTNGKTSKTALLGALYLFIRAWALVMIPVVLAGVMSGYIDWKLVEVTAAGTALMGLDKFLHDNPGIPFNGLTGF